MARDTSLTIYVEQETKDQLRREADDRDLSLSDYCLGLIEAARKGDAEEDLAEALDAEGRLLAIAAEATDQIEQSTKRVEDVARAIEEIQARTGTYAIANFELLGGTFPDTRRRQALTTGRRRVREPLADHDVMTTTGETNKRSSGDSDTNASSDRDDEDVFDRLGD